MTRMVLKRPSKYEKRFMTAKYIIAKKHIRTKCLLILAENLFTQSSQKLSDTEDLVRRSVKMYANSFYWT